MSTDTFLALIDELLESLTVQILLTVLAAATLSLISRWIVKRVSKRIIRRHKGQSKAEHQKHLDTIQTVFRRTVVAIIWTIALFTILHQLDINVSALLTGAGLIGVLVGFGAQNAVRDFLAGLFVITENQYRVGDIVTMYASGQVTGGVVEDLSLRVTRLRDMDGNLHIIRNGSAEIVTNSSFKYANVNVDIMVAYETDIDTVEKLMNNVGDTLAQDQAWAEHISEPIQFLRVDGFTETAVRVKALGKVEPAQQWAIAGEFRRRIKKEFEAHGIRMMPTTQVELLSSKPAAKHDTPS